MTCISPGFCFITLNRHEDGYSDCALVFLGRVELQITAIKVLI